MEANCYRQDGDRLLLRVRLQPGARADGVSGVVNGQLCLRLRAAAVEDRANEALRDFLAERLDTARSRVVIVKGLKSRNKTVAIRGARKPPESLFTVYSAAHRHHP